MEDEYWESEEEEEEVEDEEDEEEDADQRIKSIPANRQNCILGNSPFRLSKFPRVPPYYRYSADNIRFPPDPIKLVLFYEI